MELKNIAISLLLFTLVFTGLFEIYGEWIRTYGVSTDVDYANIYRDINYSRKNMTVMGTDMQSKLSNLSTQESDAVSSLWKGAYSSARLVFRMPDMILGLAGGFAKELGIPMWIIDVFFTILVLAMVFAIVNAFVKS